LFLGEHPWPMIFDFCLNLVRRLDRSSIFFALMIMFYKKGFIHLLDSHRWFIDAIFASISKQGFDPCAQLATARPVSATADLLLPFGERTEMVTKI
jgi:hypothetical protein